MPTTATPLHRATLLPLACWLRHYTLLHRVTLLNSVASRDAVVLLHCATLSLFATRLPSPSQIPFEGWLLSEIGETSTTDKLIGRSNTASKEAASTVQRETGCSTNCSQTVVPKTTTPSHRATLSPLATRLRHSTPSHRATLSLFATRLPSPSRIPFEGWLLSKIGQTSTTDKLIGRSNTA